MGRRDYGRRYFVEELFCLDADDVAIHTVELNRHAATEEPDSRGFTATVWPNAYERLRVDVRIALNGHNTYTGSVPLEARPCRFGGRRYFWLCPRCRKPRKRLYCYPGRFECRTCLNLAYRSQGLNYGRIATRGFAARIGLAGFEHAIHYEEWSDRLDSNRFARCVRKRTRRSFPEPSA